MSAQTLTKNLLEHRQLLFGFLLALTRSHEIAEDLFQELSIEILEEATRGTQVENFLPWARTLARHKVSDYYRRQARRATQPLTDSMSEVVSLAFEEQEAQPDEHVARMALLEQCMSVLTRRVRDLIEARYRRHQSMKEISADSGWKETSVKTALSKARKTLADCVDSKMRTSAR